MSTLDQSKAPAVPELTLQTLKGPARRTKKERAIRNRREEGAGRLRSVRWRFVQFGWDVFLGSEVCVCFGVADGGLNEALVQRRYCNTSAAGGPFFRFMA